VEDVLDASERGSYAGGRTSAGAVFNVPPVPLLWQYVLEHVPKLPFAGIESPL
jgi:hypothetical protein